MTDEVGTTANPMMTIGGMRSPNFRDIYAQNFRLRVTNMDTAIVFVSSADLPGGRQILQDEATVTMTYAGLKILSEHLTLVVQTIEQELGPIRVPVAVRPTEANKAALIQALTATPMAE